MSGFLRLAVDPFSRVFKGKVRLQGVRRNRERFDSLDNLIDEHFSKYSETNHPCRSTLTRALEKLGNQPAIIVETGSSAWGTNSSLLFDSYVNSFGGSFISVDIRAQPMVTLRSQCSPNSTFFCDDSVAFLKKFIAQDSDTKPDLIYLDSWDVDWTDPLACAVHGFHEFLVLYPLLRSRSGATLLVDDTPRDSDVIAKVQGRRAVFDFDQFTSAFGFTPGKGALIKNFLVKNSVGKEIKHDYQLLWEF